MVGVETLRSRGEAGISQVAIIDVRPDGKVQLVKTYNPDANEPVQREVYGCEWAEPIASFKKIKTTDDFWTIFFSKNGQVAGKILLDDGLTIDEILQEDFKDIVIFDIQAAYVAELLQKVAPGTTLALCIHVPQRYHVNVGLSFEVNEDDFRSLIESQAEGYNKEVARKIREILLGKKPALAHECCFPDIEIAPNGLRKPNITVEKMFFYVEEE